LGKAAEDRRASQRKFPSGVAAAVAVHHLVTRFLGRIRQSFFGRQSFCLAKKVSF